MEVINTPVSPYIQNAPIAYCTASKESIFVDPGDEIDKLINVSNNLNLKPQYIFIMRKFTDKQQIFFEWFLNQAFFEKLVMNTVWNDNYSIAQKPK